ncbi:MAG: RIP metalloprotease RseP [Bacillota bacterium]
MLTIISFVIVLGILVFIHEFGHYISAKAAGIRVEEFALGFGPKLLSTKKGETVYSIRGIPLGGFCKMTGETPPDDNMSDEEKEIYYEAKEKGQTFDQKSPLKRLAVIFNGPLMNFLLAVLIFFVVFAVYGLPIDSINSNVVGDLIPGRPAAQSGFKIGDKIIEIEGQTINDWDDLADIINPSAGEELKVVIERNNQRKNITVTPVYDESVNHGVIGIAPEIIREDINVFRSIQLAFVNVWRVIYLTFISFVRMFTGEASAEIGGPVMIASMVGQAAEIGLNSVLNLMALISINLGILNLLPFPALDGGRIIFILLEMLRGKPVNPEKENMVHIVGFVILMIFMVFIIIRDIGNFL